MIPYSLYPSLIRPLLFLLDPETAHWVTMNGGKLAQTIPGVLRLIKQSVADRPLSLMGLEFKNPVGLAAGLDKNGDAIDFLGALGFGFIEVGTVTPKPQIGNPKPRLFRIPRAQALINRMGFNNLGVEHLVRNLIKRQYKGIVGVSIGKNESTPLTSATDDYLFCMKKVYPYCDYIAINVSCPNSTDVTLLQESDYLRTLLGALKREQGRLSKLYNKYVPLVVKIAPDLDENALGELCNACLYYAVDGMICTNTTTDRSMIHGMPHARERGGLSGEPLREKSLQILKQVSLLTNQDIPLIACGGVNGPVAAREKLEHGASLVQLFSGFIYQGPRVIKDIVENI